MAENMVPMLALPPDTEMGRRRGLVLSGNTDEVNPHQAVAVSAPCPFFVQVDGVPASVVGICAAHPSGTLNILSTAEFSAFCAAAWTHCHAFVARLEEDEREYRPDYPSQSMSERLGTAESLSRPTGPRLGPTG